MSDEEDVRRLMELEHDMILMKERQHELIARLDGVQKKQEDMSGMLNKGFGFASAIMGIGIFIGWVASIGGNVSSWFRGH